MTNKQFTEELFLNISQRTLQGRQYCCIILGQLTFLTFFFVDEFVASFFSLDVPVGVAVIIYECVQFRVKPIS